MITIGIDTHKATLVASAIDGTGREVMAGTFQNEARGHAALVTWATEQGPERRFGIEGSGSYGAAFARLLVGAGETVVEVPANLTARERRHLRRAGKTDAGDALAIARVTLREPGLGPVPMPGIAEDLKLLVDAREQRIAERTRGVNRLHAQLVVIAPGYERTIPNLSATRHRGAVARLLEGQGGVRVELARAELARVGGLDAECLVLEGRIRALVQFSGSSLPMIVGVAAITAAKIMGETGDPRRFRSAPAFAAMSGTAPVPASSGQTNRHRLNRGGNRQLNRALHTIALTQSRTDPRAKAYMEKRMSEGKSWLEAMRCLKRHLANVVLRTMLADASVRSGPSGLTT
jgi:transposase